MEEPKPKLYFKGSYSNIVLKYYLPLKLSNPSYNVTMHLVVSVPQDGGGMGCPKFIAVRVRICHIGSGHLDRMT